MLVKRGLRGSSPVTVVGAVTMVVGLVLLGLAGFIARTLSDPENIAGQTSRRWDHWDTVSGVLGVTLMVLGGVITYVGRRPRAGR